MTTLKEIFIAASQEGRAFWRTTAANKEQLLINDKGVIAGNGKNAVAIYKENLREFGAWDCIEEPELFRLKKVTTKKVEAAEAEGYFEEPEPAKKTRKGS